jgi:hypothetical protein
VARSGPVIRPCVVTFQVDKAVITTLVAAARFGRTAGGGFAAQ